MPAHSPRLFVVDALKIIAFQLIVLHHLAFYGPMSDHVYPLAPDLLSWLSQQARMAVQVFLVIGGFLAARSLAPKGALVIDQPWLMLAKRYLKLVLPYFAALLISIVCAAMARALMAHDSIPAQPSWPQVMAHLLLLHTVLNYESLSAGVWYVAIDFQLFALLLGLLALARWLCRDKAGAHAVAIGLVVTLACASLYYFNRDDEWDIWGLYFFAAYALGALAYWAANRHDAWKWLMLMVMVVVLALVIDERPRIAVALAAALTLAFAQRYDLLRHEANSRWLSYLGEISYSVFLIHFSICLLVNSVFTRFAPPDPWTNLAGMCVAWLGSLVAGGLFHRFVESPSLRGIGLLLGNRSHAEGLIHAAAAKAK